MTRDAPHDFSVHLGIYRLCSRCAQPDLAANRRRPCRPLEPEAALRAIKRKVAMAQQFRGEPTSLGRPSTRGTSRTGRAKVPF